MAFFGLGFTAPSFDNQTQPQDNPFLTCWTNPCVQVDGVGKIMGSTKVKFMFSKKATNIDKIFTVDLTVTTYCQIDGQDYFNFCGLLRKREL